MLIIIQTHEFWICSVIGVSGIHDEFINYIDFIIGVVPIHGYVVKNIHSSFHIFTP